MREYSCGTTDAYRGNGVNNAVNPESVSVAIADDHKLVAQSLAYTLERAGFHVAGVSHSGKGAFDLVQRDAPDVLLLDLYMPDMGGLEVAAALRRADQAVNILILTSSRAVQDVSRAVNSEISGYLSKELTPEDLQQAILLAAEGKSVPDMKLLESIFSPRGASGQQDYKLVEELTEQELRVLRLLAEGLSNEEIASLLTVSVNTVKTHVRHIFQKLQVTDRTSAAVWAIRNGLMPLDVVPG